ncbi:hypothetical protein A0H81_05973 [Grifola frondosa]|uniref:F-box domain-containing protein n=1 Tax=Grifola frondosa TaxID=5627 RepID=A0A1C7MF19_GRIFR|nr:hypothetical protein A0H81_05973 [Grifola frondosa]
MAKDFPPNEAEPTVEIVLYIASFLDLEEILNFKQTCSAIYHWSQDKSLWLSLARYQSDHMPFPPYLIHSADLALLSLVELEQLVTSTSYIDRTWLLPRKAPSSLRPEVKSGVDNTYEDDNDSTKTFLSLQIFFSRWLLCVYKERVVELWDLQHNGQTFDLRRADAVDCPAVCRISRTVQVQALSHPMLLARTKDHNAVMIALASDSECTFLRILVPFSRERGMEVKQMDALLENVAVLPISAPAFLVRALHPSSCLAAFSNSDTLYLANWESRARWIIDVPPEMKSEKSPSLRQRTQRGSLFHNILVNSSDDIPPPNTSRLLPGHTPTSTSLDAYKSPSLNFSRRFLLGPSYLKLRRAVTRRSLSFLANDALRGYTIIVSRSCSLVLFTYKCYVPPYMSVNLLEAHPKGVISMANKRNGPIYVPRSAFTSSTGTRGLVTACALGPAGLRGVWIERLRAITKRSIIGFAARYESASGSRDERGTPVEHLARGYEEENDDEHEWRGNGTQREIDKKILYEVRSYDLRDDVTHCAFSEATGKIVLGTRKGKLQIL